MAIIEYLKIASVAISCIAALVGFGVAFFKAIRAKHGAKTEAEKAAAMNDMLIAVNGFIATAEEMYVGIDTILKQQTGNTSGAQKKENVMSKLQTYALTKGYEYDAEFWSKRVDDIVELTKKVNAKH